MNVGRHPDTKIFSCVMFEISIPYLKFSFLRIILTVRRGGEGRTHQQNRSIKTLIKTSPKTSPIG